MKDKRKHAYGTQKSDAKRRGIDWQFTFESWVDWWGDDIVNRGQGKGKLCMARYNDTGAYHPNNCRKATHEENAIEANLGKIVSKESKTKMSEAQKGRTITDEHKTKISQALTGKIISEETRKKISQTTKNKPKSAETKLKMSEAKKQYWAMRNSTQELHINTN